MPTYRIDLAYDGTRFHGYAKQPNVRTVQGELESALAHFTGDAPTFVAGRTDKGVHATGQVASLACDGALDTESVVRSLNKRLAPEIAVSSIVEVEAGFHARFSAVGRAYRYRINNSPVHRPLSAAYEWTYAPTLDVPAMNLAVGYLVGEHDFAAFCRKAGDTPTTRLVHWAAWRRRSDRVELSIGASSFCHQMVRSIVAVAVDVGRGRLAPGDAEVLLASKDRRRGRGAAPAHGLTLVAVAYGDEPLPQPGWAGARGA